MGFIEDDLHLHVRLQALWEQAQVVHQWPRQSPRPAAPSHSAQAGLTRGKQQSTSTPSSPGAIDMCRCPNSYCETAGTSASFRVIAPRALQSLSCGSKDACQGNTVPGKQAFPGHNSMSAASLVVSRSLLLAVTGLFVGTDVRLVWKPLAPQLYMMSLDYWTKNWNV
eukprot:232434-Pelagomonas_calceolata.AAC.6